MLYLAEGTHSGSRGRGASLWVFFRQSLFYDFYIPLTFCLITSLVLGLSKT